MGILVAISHNNLLVVSHSIVVIVQLSGRVTNSNFARPKQWAHTSFKLQLVIHPKSMPFTHIHPKPYTGLFYYLGSLNIPPLSPLVQLIKTYPNQIILFNIIPNDIKGKGRENDNRRVSFIRESDELIVLNILKGNSVGIDQIKQDLYTGLAHSSILTYSLICSNM